MHVHADQTRNIPEEFDVDKHGIHLTPSVTKTSLEMLLNLLLLPVYQHLDKGNFEAVQHFLSNEVIGCGKVTTMKHLHNLCDLATGDSRYRNKLKERIKKEKHQLLFLDPGVGRGEVVIAADCLDGKSLTESNVVVSAAKI